MYACTCVCIYDCMFFYVSVRVHILLYFLTTQTLSFSIISSPTCQEYYFRLSILNEIDKNDSLIETLTINYKNLTLTILK